MTDPASVPVPTPDTAALGSREIAEALGFEPDNHHNAAACPYCTHNGTFVMVRSEDLQEAIRIIRDESEVFPMMLLERWRIALGDRNAT